MAIGLVAWKSQKNVPTDTYTALRRVMLMTANIEIPSFRETVRAISKIIDFSVKKVDCCKNTCIAFTGRHRRSIRCPVCGEPRYRTPVEGDEEVPAEDLEDSDDDDTEPYPDILANRNAQVGPSYQLQMLY